MSRPTIGEHLVAVLDAGFEAAEEAREAEVERRRMEQRQRDEDDIERAGLMDAWLAIEMLSGRPWWMLRRDDVEALLGEGLLGEVTRVHGRRVVEVAVVERAVRDPAARARVVEVVSRRIII